MKRPASRLITRLSTISLAATMLVACGGGFRNGHEPGDIETLENATVYHLADGVFIHERRDRNDHYHLVEATVADWELKPAGLKIELEGDWEGALIAERQPEDYVAAFITRVPGEGPEATRFAVDASIIEQIIQEFSGATTVDEIYRRKK